MSQIQTPAEWCAQVQAKLMAALDAAWALAEKSDDPAVIAKALMKAKLCGQMATQARRIATMVPMPRARPLMAAIGSEPDTLEKPPAAQAVAMRAALRKLGRR